jgi:bile acid:Na+ symporter, BASS family
MSGAINRSAGVGGARPWFRVVLMAGMLCGVGAGMAYLFGYRGAASMGVVAGLVTLAVACSGHSLLKPFGFTAWVFAFVAASMFRPDAFMTWAGFNLALLIVPLIQVIMFGMGTTLSVGDFARVLVMPWPVLVGIVLQFSVMPVVGLAIATGFGFSPEVAAGVILVGCVSGGVASNLMAYLAGGNVALSVTMTACSTLMSPLMTPLLMKLLAGRLVPIDFRAMMLEILNMVIVPVVAGLAAHVVLYGRDPRLDRARLLGMVSVVTFGLAVGTLFVPGEWLGLMSALKGGAVVGFGLIGLVTLTKLMVNACGGREDWMDRVLPVVSMAGICFIIAIITARSREKLLTVGFALIGAAMLHNGIGYLLGYWAARAVRLNETDCRTVAFEVGMQNGGMASGLAMNVLKSAEAALAPAIFGPWMNVSGSVLASWWQRRRPGEELNAELEKG